MSEPSWLLRSLICLVALAYSATAYTDLSTDASALLAFKARMLNHSSLDWYDYATSLVCSWRGVTCGSRHRRVTGLNLYGIGLSGSLPPELGNLTFLVSLNLTRNRFEGRLPQELSRLRRLKFMELNFNHLIGEFPAWIGLLNKLQILRLRYNSFNGSLPRSLANASKLERVSLQFNNFEGKIPASVFNLSNLRYFDIYRNKFSGTLSSQICNGIPKIESLILGFNELEGEIPPNISSCLQLRELSFEGNRFVSPMPMDIEKLKALEVLDVSENSIMGTFPVGVRNLTELRWLDLSQNELTGVISKEFGTLSKLENANLGYNMFTGDIPVDLFNISTLIVLSISGNKLGGKIPTNPCARLRNLVDLFLDYNELVGEIPQSISNCTHLRQLILQGNHFSGIIPQTIGELGFLGRLDLSYNDFICEDSECTFIRALANCGNLRELALSNNPFHSSLPGAAGNWSASLVYFDCSSSSLYGIIPTEFGNLTSLIRLNLENNNLMGSIPSTFEKLSKLQGLFLSNNKINGFIPDALCGLTSSSVIYLHGNEISGSIPTCIGNSTALEKLWISDNKLESTIPSTLWRLSNILELNLSMNILNGSLPSDIGNLNVAYLVDLSVNRLSGAIPTSIGDMNGLTYLSLAFNEFQGSIPETIASILSLEQVNLSHNRLSGSIPTALQGISSLVYFDVSFNSLSGPIPSEGPFKNFSYHCFDSNKELCGESRFRVTSCRVPNDGSQRRRTLVLVAYALSSIFAVIFALFLVCTWCSRFRKNDVVQDGENPIPGITPNRISYYEIVRATESFSSDHLLGTGAFGSVYKGVLQNGEVLAIKVFNLQREMAPRSFAVECEVFRSLRHRNLCKVIRVCSNDDFKALAMEYMSNGSLETWLHGENHCLSIMQRFFIMIDIASALEYLHHGYTIPIVHCDVKPSNILLDDDMIAHLSDFGIAKLLGGNDSFVHTGTFATQGYIAPEYGSDGLVSTRCDVYSFGMVLMEVFTGKKPNDEEFAGDLTLKSLVRNSISDGITQIVDSRLLNLDEVDLAQKLECLSLVLELSLKCSSEAPNDRMGMKDVVVTLKCIFSRFARNTHES